MEPQPNATPVIAIVGETASGKTALALELAARFNGEIIAADSRTVYRGLDIGTAKPTPSERQAIPHHLIDVATPDQQFTAADFKRLALDALQQIGEAGNVAFLVGGTGLYIDAVLYDFSFRPKTDEAIRRQLQELSVDELQALLMERRIALPENARNPRHLVRSLETGGLIGERHALRQHTLILGLHIDREQLRQKITARVDAMVDAGLVSELAAAAQRYGWEAAALQTPGYKAFRQYLQGDIPLEEAKELFVRADMQLAKRQRTWFKRNKDIHWISKPEEAVDLVTTFLNK